VTLIEGAKYLNYENTTSRAIITVYNVDDKIIVFTTNIKACHDIANYKTTITKGGQLKAVAVEATKR